MLLNIRICVANFLGETEYEDPDAKVLGHTHAVRCTSDCCVFWWSCSCLTIPYAMEGNIVLPLAVWSVLSCMMCIFNLMNVLDLGTFTKIEWSASQARTAYPG